MLTLMEFFKAVNNGFNLLNTFMVFQITMLLPLIRTTLMKESFALASLLNLSRSNKKQ